MRARGREILQTPVEGLAFMRRVMLGMDSSAYMCIDCFVLFITIECNLAVGRCSKISSIHKEGHNAEGDSDCRADLSPITCCLCADLDNSGRYDTWSHSRGCHSFCGNGVFTEDIKETASKGMIHIFLHLS